jgi:hypothetical protein
VRGRIIGGGSGPRFLIAVNDTWGRIYDVSANRLYALVPLTSAWAHDPGSLCPPFDGFPEEEEAILDACVRADVRIEPQIPFGFRLPDEDIIDRARVPLA